jgi:hypothetical protein
MVASKLFSFSECIPAQRWKEVRNSSKGSIAVAFWMCSLDVQRTVCCNDMRYWCAAKLAAYLRNTTPRCMPRCTPCCMRFRCHFLFPTYFLTWVLKNPRSAACIVMLRLCSATSHCTSKTQVTAADGSLHIQTARSKRKCNRPLIARRKKLNANGFRTGE